MVPVNALNALLLIMATVVAAFVTTIIAVASSSITVLMILVIGGAMIVIKTVIYITSHPPWRRVFLFAQVRARHGLTKTQTVIDDNTLNKNVANENLLKLTLQV